MVNPALITVMRYVHKKTRCGPEIATFRTKTLHFLRVIRLNWLAKIELRGARRPWSSILLLVIVVSKKCYKETEETIGFFATFLSLVKFQGPAPPLGYVYAPSEENKKGLRKFYAGFLAFSNEISTVQKIVLSSSRGQGDSRGLEASRTRPRTSKCVLEAKGVLEDSTSASGLIMKYEFVFCSLVTSNKNLLLLG